MIDCQWRRQRAFTLFELLLVMTIVAIMVSAVVFSMNPDNSHRELEREAKRLTEILREVADDAVFQDHELGLVLDENQYAFLVWDRKEQHWLPMENDSVFRPYKLPESVRMRITVEDIPYSLLTPSEENVEESSIEQPSESETSTRRAGAQDADASREGAQAWLLSSGEITPFVIELSSKDEPLRRYTISASAMGEIVLENTHAP